MADVLQKVGMVTKPSGYVAEALRIARASGLATRIGVSPSLPIVAWWRRYSPGVRSSPTAPVSAAVASPAVRWWTKREDRNAVAAGVEELEVHRVGAGEAADVRYGL